VELALLTCTLIGIISGAERLGEPGR